MSWVLFNKLTLDDLEAASHLDRSVHVWNGQTDRYSRFTPCRQPMCSFSYMLRGNHEATTMDNKAGSNHLVRGDLASPNLNHARSNTINHKSQC